jgi:hypothetical protein
VNNGNSGNDSSGNVVEFVPSPRTCSGGDDLEEYDSILEVAQNDPDIREKIRQRIRPSAQ